MSSARTTRRRGGALETAIYDAVLSELAEVGYGRLTMEGIATRARTAKSSLYRRWSSLEELVIAAIDPAMASPERVPEAGDLRTDLVGVLTPMAETVGSPTGRAVTSILGEINRSPKLRRVAEERFLAPRIRAATAIFERAVERGEIRAGAVTPYVVHAGPALILHFSVVWGRKLSRKDVEDIVDQVIMPAVART